jgi:hypothetical protein
MKNKQYQGDTKMTNEDDKPHLCVPTLDGNAHVIPTEVFDKSPEKERGRAMPKKSEFVENLGVPMRDAAELSRITRRFVDSAEAEEYFRTYPDEDGVTPTSDEVLVRANEILRGFGVESARCEGCQVNRYYYDAVLLYVNMGDTYSTTLLYDTDRQKFSIGSWGDWIEQHEAEHEQDEDLEEEGDEDDG